MDNSLLFFSWEKFQIGWDFWLVCAISSIDFSFAHTSLFRREGLPLYAIIGGFRNISTMCFISFQCFIRICFSLVVSSQNWVMNTSLCVWLSLCFFSGQRFLSLVKFD